MQLTVINSIINHKNHGDPDIDLPFECCNCPFGVLDPHEPFPNYTDPGEGHFQCSLLGPEITAQRNQENSESRGYEYYQLGLVWGENPLCTVDDWRNKARDELEIINKLVESFSTAGMADLVSRLSQAKV